METSVSPEITETVTQGMSSGEMITFIYKTWFEGGWLMIPLCLLALLIYFEAMSLILRLGKAKVKKTPRSVWSNWLTSPSEGHGHIGEIIKFITGASNKIEEISITKLEAVKSKFIPDINNRIIVLSVLVTIAPLMGLLGTVIGMLTTFRGLATSTGQAVDLVAEGIRVALITTQTGLMIAIPGYIFISLVVRKRNEYLGFLAELETSVVQIVHRNKEEDAA